MLYIVSQWVYDNVTCICVNLIVFFTLLDTLLKILVQILTWSVNK